MRVKEIMAYLEVLCLERGSGEPREPQDSVSWPACEPDSYRIQLRGLGTEVDVIRDLHSRVNGFESRPNVTSLGLVFFFSFLSSSGSISGQSTSGVRKSGVTVGPGI